MSHTEFPMILWRKNYDEKTQQQQQLLPWQWRRKKTLISTLESINSPSLIDVFDFESPMKVFQMQIICYFPSFSMVFFLCQNFYLQTFCKHFHSHYLLVLMKKSCNMVLLIGFWISKSAPYSLSIKYRHCTIYMLSMNFPFHTNKRHTRKTFTTKFAPWLGIISLNLNAAIKWHVRYKNIRYFFLFKFMGIFWIKTNNKWLILND